MGSYPRWLQPPKPALTGNVRRHDLEGLYGELKRQWVAEHPEATPAEYEAAITAIADRLEI